MGSGDVYKRQSRTPISLPGSRRVPSAHQLSATASSCGCPGRYRASNTTIPSHLYGDRVSSHLYVPTHFFSLSLWTPDMGVPDDDGESDNLWSPPTTGPLIEDIVESAVERLEVVVTSDLRRQAAVIVARCRSRPRLQQTLIVRAVRDCANYGRHYTCCQTTDGSLHLVRTPWDLVEIPIWGSTTHKLSQAPTPTGAPLSGGQPRRA